MKEPYYCTNLTFDVLVLKYFYSVRVFAGQDPSSVWVGWVTPDYHYYSKHFNLSTVRTVTVTLGDERGRVHERSVQKTGSHFQKKPVYPRRIGNFPWLNCVLSFCHLFYFSVRRSNCYMVCAGDVVSGSTGRSNTDLEIGCCIDLASGLVSFTANGRDLPTAYQVISTPNNTYILLFSQCMDIDACIFRWSLVAFLVNSNLIFFLKFGQIIRGFISMKSKACGK